MSIGNLPDGKRFVRLADNIREEVRTEGETEQTMYVYDEVSFELGEDRQDTIEEIEENFEAWWDFGSEPEEAEPTIEERLEIIEDVLISLLGGDE